jgi:putative flavoprotein involved in K+ transport
MDQERFEVVVVGGGQAGLAMSHHLTARGRAHVVLEQECLAESWRSRRWDSLHLVVPNAMLRLPGFAYAGDDPDGFLGKAAVVAFLETYARSFGAPVREGVRVTAVARDPAGANFLVRTSDGDYRAERVVVATGALQRPRVPDWAAALPAGIAQVVPTAYRNPAALPPGAVLVVGSGETGCQIAEELRRAGRDVYLSVGRGWWCPRRYRGREIGYWTEDLGGFDRTVDGLPPGARDGGPGPQLTGSDGGRDLNVHTLAREGVVLVGHCQGVRDGRVAFALDLAETLAKGDEQALGFLRSVDEFVRQRGLVAPAEGPPAYLLPVAELARGAPAELDLAEAGIGAVVWATGYRPDLGWLGQPILDAEGYPVQRRGVTSVPGLYLLGLHWLYKARSGLFDGVGDDAAYLAAVIAGEREPEPLPSAA